MTHSFVINQQNHTVTLGDGDLGTAFAFGERVTCGRGVGSCASVASLTMPADVPPPQQIHLYSE
tara:strand:- start:951 stop:1142 length:192 start_codon:yes stop_codon:yes gene_type:complete